MGFFDKLKKGLTTSKFSGFTSADFEKKDRFEIYDNNSLLTDDQQLAYDSFTSSKQKEFIKEFVKSFPNYSLTWASDCEDAIYEHGFNIYRNNLLRFIVNLDFKIHFVVLDELVRMLKDEKLSAGEDWLYFKHLYDEEPDDVIFKIKALTLASDERLQENFVTKISPSDLMDDEGRILSADDMKRFLNTIEVTKPPRN